MISLQKVVQSLTRKGKPLIIIGSVLLLSSVIIAAVILYKDHSYKKYLDSLDYISYIDSDELSLFLNEGDNMLLYIGRPTCADCRRVYPELIESVNDSKTYVRYYDTDREKPHKLYGELITSLNIEYVPTIVYFEGGREVARIVEDEIEGKETIDTFIETNIAY